MVEKSAEAFRTISEVATQLDTPAHVLRFWEGRFTQVKPVKRAGGRRYYRPDDVALLDGIRKLLHEDGLTIRGVQKILKEQGAKHVAAYSSGEVIAEPEAKAATPAPAHMPAPAAANPPGVAARPARSPRAPKSSADAPELPFDLGPALRSDAPAPKAAPETEAEPLPLSARLRALPPGRQPAKSPALRALHARLAALHARMVQAQDRTQG